ncbi:hypothetical protein KIL84_021042 [Mauremys mutica]|uniref:Uncharacterized protein n=1 Tax=Mauremys mutica TaxID=74926 RepID=A0A9D4AZL3_9SAUR|nr:hypothetical protein KIL84_021042 [Mauremys mutica]
MPAVSAPLFPPHLPTLGASRGPPPINVKIPVGEGTGPAPSCWLPLQPLPDSGDGRRLLSTPPATTDPGGRERTCLPHHRSNNNPINPPQAPTPCPPCRESPPRRRQLERL